MPPTPRRPARHRSSRRARKGARIGRGKGVSIVRYAVIGQGYFAQAAVLPAFAQAPNSRLVALVSDDDTKLRTLKRKYGAEQTLGYDGYDDLLASGDIDAVYIALPNDMHRDFAVRAAEAGVHVLCEKPMALDAEECEAMIGAAERNHVRLMVAYRLHFEPANLAAVEAIRKGRIGKVRTFNSTFCFPVAPGNIRTQAERGGGPLYDIGIYCVNAARYLFQAEPVDVVARMAASGDPRFREVEETVSAILTFPGDRIASFTASYGAASTAWYEV
ncbi:MAG: Gfo/Idh/MocA family protein, partial [Thermoplasmatota archaeon]